MYEKTVKIKMRENIQRRNEYEISRMRKSEKDKRIEKEGETRQGLVQKPEKRNKREGRQERAVINRRKNRGKEERNRSEREKKTWEPVKKKEKTMINRRKKRSGSVFNRKPFNGDISL